MGTDSRNEIEKSTLSSEAQQKMDELVGLLAAEKFGPDGPPRNTTFAEIEDYGHQVGRVVARTVDEHLALQHAEHFEELSACPTCSLLAEPKEERRERVMQTRDGPVPMEEPAFACPTCNRAFFPQRTALAIDGRSYSPAVLEKVILVGAHAPSYAVGAKLLEVVGEIRISSRQLNNLTAKIGTELAGQRAASVAAYVDEPLPRKHRTAETPIALAYVSIDGGRMQTRLDGGGLGVHDPHWRETKNALFLRMNGVSFEEDPHPELPKCFADRHRMKTLLPGVAVDDSPRGQPLQASCSNASDWRPQKLFRTCLSSLTCSKKFGPMMAVEAESRGFYHAEKRAFVGDGLPYNWTIHAAYFPTFTPVLDFVHAVEHASAAARCLAANDDDDTWALHLSWTTSI